MRSGASRRSRLRIPDPSLVVLVGAAGAGKSTLAQRLFDPDEILSSDALRAAVLGDEADQRSSAVVFKILQRTLDRRMAAGRLTVIDATSARPEHRRQLLVRAERAGVPAVALVLDLTPEEIHAQNAGRSRQVERAVIDRHIAWIRRTIDHGDLTAEGFETVLILRSAAAAAALDIVRQPAVAGARPAAAPTSGA